VSGHALHELNAPVILEIVGDTGSAKRVTADFSLNASIMGTPTVLIIALEMMQWLYGYPIRPELPGLALPKRDHRPLRLVVLPLQSELSRYPSDDVRARGGSLA
jgi:hypothetical protein